MSIYSGISDTIVSWKRDRLLDNMDFSSPALFTNWLGASETVMQRWRLQKRGYSKVCDLAGLQ